MELQKYVPPLFLAFVAVAPCVAQDAAHTGHTAPPTAAPSENHDTMPGMDHSAHQTNAPGQTSPVLGHSAHTAMPGTPSPSALRDPHAYADGYDFSQFPMRHLEHARNFTLLQVERFEAQRADADTLFAYDAQASYGDPFERAVLKVEGEKADTNVDLLWRHAFAPFWDAQFGVRYEYADTKNWGGAALGVLGLAPYWFEVSAMAYLGEEGRSVLKLDAEYEVLLTQKWIAQPRVEANLYGKDDAQRTHGAGLSDMTLSVRIRYEIYRELAPYLGVEWQRRYGLTAEYARQAGLQGDALRGVAGIRIWF